MVDYIGEIILRSQVVSCAKQGARAVPCLADLCSVTGMPYRFFSHMFVA